MSEPFIGEIRIFGCNFAPRGWAFCQGQLLPIAQNTALFSILGTTYGGDGRTTLALPDLQGRAPMHPGRGPGLTARRLGEKTGVDEVTLTDAELPNHKHVLYGAQIVGTEASPSNTRMMAIDRPSTGDNIMNLNAASTKNTVMATEAIGTMGGSQAHENRQPLMGMNFCIALVGLYPSRS